MKHSGLLLAFVIILNGCADPAAMGPVSVVVESRAPVSELPEPKNMFRTGQALPVPAVGIATADGSFEHVLYLCQPLRRGGSVKPVALTSPSGIKVYRGTQPQAADNTFLGTYTLEPVVPAVEVGFDLAPDQTLSLWAKDAATGAFLKVTKA